MVSLLIHSFIHMQANRHGQPHANKGCEYLDENGIGPIFQASSTEWQPGGGTFR